MSPEVSFPCFSNNAFTCWICSVRISVMSVIALTAKAPLPVSSNSILKISSPFNLRKSLCAIGKSLIRDDSAYMAFFLRAMLSWLDRRRRSSGNAPCFSAACCTFGLLFQTKIDWHNINKFDAMQIKKELKNKRLTSVCALKKLIFFTRNVILLEPSFIGSKRMTGIMWKERDYDPGGWTPHMKRVGMLVISLRGCKFQILVSHRVFSAKCHHI